MATDNNDDEPITLSSHALSALEEFYTERDAHAETFEKLKAQAEENAAGGHALTMEAFTEDWNESQFWESKTVDTALITATERHKYSDRTAQLLARELLDGATAESTVAVVSAPSVFVALKNMVNAAGPGTPRPRLLLLEHDQRFAVFPEFVFYDFAQPFKLPVELKGTVDRIICDPPFLSEDCQTKAALTVRWLSQSSGDDAAMRLIICTGERMEALVNKLYRTFGLKTTTYEPVHSRGLSNEFYCYANFESNEWTWKGELGG